MNKSDLLAALESSREDFLNLIDNLDEAQMVSPGVIEQWSIKDILAHLTRWEAELVKLLWQIRTNQRPTTVHFGGQSIDEINQRWFIDAQKRALEIVLEDFHGVRSQTIRQVDAYLEKDLIQPGRYPRLRGDALASWVIIYSFGHEKEHAADIQRWQQQAIQD